MDSSKRECCYVYEGQIAELRAALKKIMEIENREFGPDWEEIEEARSIARTALIEN